MPARVLMLHSDLTVREFNVQIEDRDLFEEPVCQACFKTEVLV